ncbi:endolytic transglycosylase MltG [Candidatus Margulisiibacteriota bacterium]
MTKKKTKAKKNIDLDFFKKKLSSITNSLKNYWDKILKYIIANPLLKKVLIVLLLFIITMSLFFSAFLYQVKDRFYTKEVIFKVGQSEAATYISYHLKNEGIIPNIIGFRLMAKLLGVENKFHVGEYKLTSSMNLLTILNTLQEKGSLSLTSGTIVTIPEGYSIIEIADVLDEKGICSKTTFLKAAFNGKYSPTAQHYEFTTAIPINSLEGYLFPDTYILPKNSSPNIVINAMLKRFAKAIKPYQQEIAKNNLSLHQLITLASIIEKEAVVPEEREVIGGIFRKRLQYRMYLGSCPTVKYAMGRPRLPYLLYKHLNIKHPYNTYRTLGLPPGPIASPGLPSIMASLRPLKTEYLYFVSKGDGTHIFTTSLQEHLNKQKEVQEQTGGKIF